MAIVPCDVQYILFFFLVHCSLYLLCPRDFLGNNTGVGCHALLQEIFLTQGSNVDLLYVLHWQLDSLPLSHPQVFTFIAHTKVCSLP